MNELVIKDKCFEITPNGLRVIGNYTFEQWVQFGKGLSIFHKGLLFLIGDWVNAGEERFGEKYAQALSETDFAYQTLANAASIARKIPMERRRLEKLSGAIHATVASLTPEEQIKWLRRAEEEKLSVRELRLLVKGEDKDEVVDVTINAEGLDVNYFKIYRKDYERILARLSKIEVKDENA